MPGLYFDLATLSVRPGDVVQVGLMAEDGARKRAYSLTRRIVITPQSVGVDASMRIAELRLAQNFEAAKLEEVRSTPLISVIDQPDVFVEPLLRHTLLKVLAAFLVATVLVAGFTLATAVLRRAGEGELGGYREFMEVLRDATADVRRLFGRAA